MKLDDLKDLAQVAIIDDIYEEGLPLVDVLNKNGIASVFYYGRDLSEIRNKLPNKPLTSCRLVFLDLDFNAIPASSPKDKASFPLTFLKEVIGESNAYVLVIWSSKTTKEIGKEFLRRLSNRNTDIGEPVCEPLLINKAEVKNSDGSYSLFKIERKIRAGLKNLPAFGLFLHSERLATSGVANALSGIIAKRDNSTLEAIIKALADASSGDSRNSNRLINDAFIALNEVFKDSIERQIENEAFDYYKMSATGKLQDQDRHGFNKQIIFSTDCTVTGSGSIYEFSPKLKERKRFIKSTFKLQYENLNEKNSRFCKDKLTFVYINVTQLCDSAKPSNIKYYVLGVIHPKRFKTSGSSNKGLIIANDSHGYTLLKPFEFEGKPDHKLTINLKTFSDSPLPNDIKLSEIRLRSNIVIDIQHKIASYISRPGHIWL